MSFAIISVGYFPAVCDEEEFPILLGEIISQLAASLPQNIEQAGGLLAVRFHGNCAGFRMLDRRNFNIPVVAVLDMMD